MPKKGIEIHRLEAKVRVIAQTMYELGRIESDSNREFAIKADIGYDRLKKSWREGRMTPDLQELVSQYAEFDIGNPNWIDGEIPPAERIAGTITNYRGRDTVDNFRHMLRSQHDLPAGLYIRLDGNQPRLTDANLLRIEAYDNGQKTVVGESLQLFFILVIEPGFIEENLVFGFNRIRLKLKFQNESRLRVQDAGQFGQQLTIREAKLSSRGGQYTVEWFLSVDKGILEGEYATRDHPLCQLSQGRIGDTFSVEAAVRPMDGSLRSVNGADLPVPAKQRIVEILSRKRLSGVTDSHGWMSLGTQELTIIRSEEL